MNYLLLVWNVYSFNLNSNVIKPFNIFCHNKFKKDVVNNLKECNDKDEFAEKLKSNLRYYFWSKCEWEIYINWFDNDELKVDVYDQVMLNWNVFLNYVWNSKNYVLSFKE